MNARPAPKLIFKEGFDQRSDKEQIEYLKKLCAAQNEALDIMQKERNEWRDKAKVFEQQVANAQQNLDVQKKINIDAITQQNADNQQNHERIRQLERKIGELGGNLD